MSSFNMQVEKNVPFHSSTADSNNPRTNRTKAPQRQLNGSCRIGVQISKGFKLKVCNELKKERLRLERRKMYISA